MIDAPARTVAIKSRPGSARVSSRINATKYDQILMVFTMTWRKYHFHVLITI